MIICLVSFVIVCYVVVWSVLINEELGDWFEETAPLKLHNPMKFWNYVNNELKNLRAIPSIVLPAIGWVFYLIVLFLSLRWAMKLIWKDEVK